MEADKSCFQPLDLLGKVIIKVQLGDDIRKVLIHNESITYDELLLMMQRIFNGKLTANDDLTIKYKDEDGDLVTVFDSQDLSFALQTSRVLKLQVFMNDLNQSKDHSKSILNAEELKKQLRDIRNAVTQMLDIIDVPREENSSNICPNSIQPDEVNVIPTQQPADNGITKEFDPLDNSKEEQPKIVQPIQIKCPQGKWVPYPPSSIRPSYPPAQYSYVYSTQLPAPGYNQMTAQMKPPTGNPPPVHSMYYPANTTPNSQYTTSQYPGQ
ncbi:protein TFG-like isoform X3 [Daktulosphaira vitifoliae]|uniref:protein TFG-like isoform X3 n=1 Tax=Daktulosphaira vitifoliae TaxID=58002 RepID=UPI0021AA9C0F|nr:protein TFG-like isoform X3 [Daktulosphaira vitifoliae]